MSKTYRADLPALPPQLRHLPVDGRGYPVPWFVQSIDGVPDHRIIDRGKLVLAVKERRCWICGRPLDRALTFVVGPMCVINRLSAEPPAHWVCAEYATRACPFLGRPKMHRREAGLPEERVEIAGMEKRNPGVMALWRTRSYDVVPNGPREVLFGIGKPIDIAWITEGRKATKGELDAAIASGVALLREAAGRNGDALAIERAIIAAAPFVAGDFNAIGQGGGP